MTNTTGLVTMPCSAGKHSECHTSHYSTICVCECHHVEHGSYLNVNEFGLVEGVY